VPKDGLSSLIPPYTTSGLGNIAFQGLPTREDVTTKRGLRRALLSIVPIDKRKCTICLDDNMKPSVDIALLLGDHAFHSICITSSSSGDNA